MLSPLSHLSIHSFSWDGVKPVRTGSHGPRAPIPPSSAFDTRTNVDFGVVFTAWLSGSNPHLIACTCFFLHGRLSNWCIGIRSEEHTSELSHLVISYAVFCLKKKNINVTNMTLSYFTRQR